MKLWGQKSETESQSNPQAGGSFEEAAARVTAEPVPGSDEEVTRNAAELAGAVEEGDSLAIRPEWAEAAARLCFLPAARLSHPAYSLSDEEAEQISPKMQAFLQAVADKYAPAMLGRVANKYPEFFDLTAALGVLYWQKWRYVSKLRQWEAEQEREAAAKARASEAAPAVVSVELPATPPPRSRPKVGERTEEGALVI
jgi:hypothetical protein